MEGEPVKNAIAPRAPGIFTGIWHAETLSELSHEDGRLHAFASGRHGCQERPRLRLRFRPQDGLCVSSFCLRVTAVDGVRGAAP